MVRRRQTATYEVEVPAWVMDYEPGPQWPEGVNQWFLAVRDYCARESIRTRSMDAWLTIMAEGHATRARINGTNQIPAVAHALIDAAAHK